MVEGCSPGRRIWICRLQPSPISAINDAYTLFLLTITSLVLSQLLCSTFPVTVRRPLHNEGAYSILQHHPFREGGVFIDLEAEDAVLEDGDGEDQDFGFEIGIMFGGEFGGEVAIRFGMGAGADSVRELREAGGLLALAAAGVRGVCKERRKAGAGSGGGGGGHQGRHWLPDRNTADIYT
ncbi:hypothetical protein E2542_SST11588 [Spatholobus suberectus]|nr:hypothetical protein E2542_SST11588 [Spatholobus suberectus]